MLKRRWFVVGVASAWAMTLVGGALAAVPSSASESASGSTQGVTSSTITIGIPYVDLAAVAQFTSGLNQGSYPGAYGALIKSINASGGINGRKIKADYVAVNPIGSDSSSAACTQLTEDDQVFAVVGFLQNNDSVCYTNLHQTPIIGGTMTTQLLAGAKAAWFDTTPIDNVLEPATINAAAKAGAFKGKKVAVMSLSNEPSGLTNSVLTALKKNGVKPVATATVTANTSDPEASLQQISGVVALKFRSAGANIVVPVGQAAQTWGNATASGSYHPQIVAPSYNDLSSYTGTGTPDPAVIENAVTAYLQPLSVGTKPVGWTDPTLQRCVNTVKSAGQSVTSPMASLHSSNQTFVSVVQACQNLALFQAIVKKAGKNLTPASFQKAGNALGAVHIPGLGNGTYSKAAPAGSFPLYLYKWSQSQGAFLPSSTAYGQSG
jgi:hypothetical protein